MSRLSLILTSNPQVRVWLLVIPIPGVPCRPVAIMPIRSQVARPELREWHDEVEAHLASRDLHHISYNVDGVSIERGLTHDLLNEAIDSGNVRTWTFEHPHPGEPDIQFDVPVLKNGKPHISGSDGKHAKKNARNAIHSGARFLAVGRYPVHLGQLIELVDCPRSPMLKTDVLGVDKQDDRAPARLNSSATIRHIAANKPRWIGLATYLYIIGEIIDAQQNRSISHAERILMLARGRFFLEGWREYVVSHPLYTPQTHFLGPEIYDILQIFISSMISLILIHRQYYPEIPLLPWIHSTEALEHFFGCARTTKADFTMAEFIANLRKTILLMHGEIRSGVAQPSASAHRSGYHHFYHNTKGIDLSQLCTWPSDAEIRSSLMVAWQEAQALLLRCGMGDGFIPSSVICTTTSSSDLRTGNLSSDYLPTQSATHGEPKSTSEQLERALRQDHAEPMSDSNNARMVVAGVAATALYIHEAHQL
jgi:hypothetical protein